jgi:hypothetical protein
LQNAGVAGDTRLAGVGPLSATTKSVAATQVAESIDAAPLGIPISVEATPAFRDAHLTDGSLPNEIEVCCEFIFAHPPRKIKALSGSGRIFTELFFIRFLNIA